MTGIQRETERADELSAMETTVAGGVVAWCARGHADFGREVLALCPASSFIGTRQKEAMEACARLLGKGDAVDLPSVVLEMQNAKALCGAAELADMVHSADRSTTRSGIREAAGFIRAAHLKQVAGEKLDTARGLCSSNLPLETILDAIQDAGAILQGKGQEDKGKGVRHPLDLDPLSYSAVRFEGYPPSFSWLLHNSFLSNDLGVIVGPPGTGKSTLALHLLAAIASGGRALDVWDVRNPVPSLYISAEDSEAVLHRRVYHILLSMNLPEEQRRAVAERLFIIPARGDVALFRDGAKTKAESFVRRHLEATKARVLVLDTLSRFSGIEENDNASMTDFCAMLENIAKEYSCNVLLLHHTNKQSGDCLDDEKALSLALSQTAMRGASALSGCARWVLVMASLGNKLAAGTIGPEARGAASGSYVAVRVAKKNAGAPEPRYFFQRREHGLLQRVEAMGADATLEDDAKKLAAEVKRREELGEVPLSESKGASELLSYGIQKGKRVTEKAVQLGLIEIVDKEKGHGKVLKFQKFQTEQNFGIFNYE